MSQMQPFENSSRLQEFFSAPTPEAVFIEQMARVIETRRTHAASPAHATPTPLKLLLVGYNGAGNIGADVRVSEIIRQIKAILGPQQVELALTILGDHVPPDVFAGAEQVVMQGYAVDFLDAVADRYDGLIACEGSMFKSNYSDIFSALMGAALGVAAVQGKLAVGYAGDIGPMNARLRDFICQLGTGPCILSRSPESGDMARQLGLRVEAGADTAWTYEPASPQASRQLIHSLGIERGPLLAICPVNPFWLPVKADVARGLELAQTGAQDPLHFGSIFFFQDSAERRRRFDAYLDALASAARTWREETEGSVLIVGMERIDTGPCAELASRLPFPAAKILSQDHPVAAIVGALRTADLLMSSRYHAIVTSMPALVPAIGVSLDERIANLMHGYGAGERLLDVDDPLLGDKLIAVMRKVQRDPEAIRDATGREVVRQIKNMAAMGKSFAAEVHRVYPHITIPQTDAGLEQYLPPLFEGLKALLEQYG